MRGVFVCPIDLGDQRKADQRLSKLLPLTIGAPPFIGVAAATAGFCSAGFAAATAGFSSGFASLLCSTGRGFGVATATVVGFEGTGAGGVSSFRPIDLATRSKKPGSLCVLVRTTDGAGAGVAVTAGVASTDGFGGLIASGITVPGAEEYEAMVYWPPAEAPGETPSLLA